MKIKQWMTVAAVAVVLGLTSACTIEISRNDNGSLSVESVMSEESLESELATVFDDDRFEDVAVQLGSGQVSVTAQRRRSGSDVIDELSLRLDLGVSGGQLTATINDAEINGAPIADARVETWNVQIADRLTRAAQRHPYSTLETVSVTNNGVIMRWHVETRRNRNA